MRARWRPSGRGTESSPPFGHRYYTLPPLAAEPHRELAEAPLVGGLSNIAYWVQYFAEHPPPDPPRDPTTYRRGAVWA